MGGATGVLDPAVIEQLQALARAGNPGLLDRLQASFARDTPERLRALRTAVAAGDDEGVAFGLHTLRGSAANLGAIRIVAICQELEGAPGAPLEPQLAELERTAAEAGSELARLAENL